MKPAGNSNALPPELIAEAAAWLAVLHGPSRTAELEQAFRRWLGASALNAQAFEEVTESWEFGSRLQRPTTPRESWRGASGQRRMALLLGSALVVLIGIGAALFQQRGRHIETEIGEQRSLMLDDGTQVSLNTRTRIAVRFDREARRVDIESGEAFFDVARRPDLPFVVSAAGRAVRVLGTAFDVRLDPGRATVILVEGKVSVAANAAGGTDWSLQPGERLVLPARGIPVVDKPVFGQVLAWRSREVVLDDTALADAVAEMNRYARTTLVLSNRLPDIHVTGRFRAGDSLSFARAVAATYALHVESSDREIRLLPAD